MSGLVGPGGRPLGTQPVVAHVLTLPDATTAADIHAITTYWQRTMGVPAVCLVGGVRLVASVLADGSLVELPADNELTVKVQALINGRTAGRPPVVTEADIDYDPEDGDE